MWKGNENDEYESSSPAIQAHFHALKAEEAYRKRDFVTAEKEDRAASEKFLQVAKLIDDRRTIEILVLLAESYEHRANEWKARVNMFQEPEEQKHVELSNKNTSTATQPKSEKKDKVTFAAPSKQILSKEITASCTPRSRNDADIPFAEKQSNAAVVNTTENQLTQAAAEMEELWQRLNEIGLARNGSSDKAYLLASSRHLSSSLGDSFCLLPTRTRNSIDVHATAVDGGTTLRAAVASRMRNQRVRLMEKQYGPRAAGDQKPPILPVSIAETSSPSGTSFHPFRNETTSNSSSVSSGSDGSKSQSPRAPLEGEEVIAHQKYEIMRLLNTVKTLSTENTKLLKKCEGLATIHDENSQITESMESFKKEYNQKLIMIKRALEEWRRQRDQNNLDGHGMQQSHQPVPGYHVSPSVPSNSELENKLRMQDQQIAQLIEANRLKEEQLLKYEKWYKALKAGAKAKQRNQNASGTSSNSSMNSSTSSISSMNGSGVVTRESFTNATSSNTTNDQALQSFTTHPQNSSSLRPPAHPHRRAL